MKTKIVGIWLLAIMSIAGLGSFQALAQDWGIPPAEFQAIARKGFTDGVEGARKDYENHRPPDVNNRDEYRHPHGGSVAEREDYRRGFARGYQVGVAHMYQRGPGRY
jgi:hypothetical protein